jgi:hypothetical protein
MGAASGEGGVHSGPLAGPEQAAARDPMNSNESEEEPWLSREELVEREYQIKRREYDELQRLIEERCREAAIRGRMAQGLCANVPIPSFT